VSVGVDHDTAEFAVATLERWWLVEDVMTVGDRFAGRQASKGRPRSLDRVSSEP